MATFKIDTTIYISNHRINSKEDVRTELQEMLDAYFYDNRSDCAEIVIKHKEDNADIKKITKKQYEKECYGL